MIGEAYLPNRVDRLGVEPLEFRLDALRLDTVTVGLVGFGTQTRLRTAERERTTTSICLSTARW